MPRNFFLRAVVFGPSFLHLGSKTENKSTPHEFKFLPESLLRGRITLHAFGGMRAVRELARVPPPGRKGARQDVAAALFPLGKPLLAGL